MINTQISKVIIIVLIVFFFLISYLIFLYIKKYISSEINKMMTEKNNECIDSMKILIKDNNTTLLTEIIAGITAAQTQFIASHQEETSTDAIINPAFPAVIKDSVKIHHDDLMSTFAKLRNIIKDDLFYTMNLTDACRVALYLLHNGQSSTAGVGFYKVSCVGERILIGSGIKERLMNHTNIPINIFDNMMSKIVETGKYIIMNDPETMATSRGTFISSNKIKYSQAVAVYDANNNILGFILAEYNHPYNKDTSETEYESLRQLSNKIAPMMTYSEYADIAASTTNTVK